MGECFTNCNILLFSDCRYGGWVFLMNIKLIGLVISVVVVFVLLWALAGKKLDDDDDFRGYGL